MLINLAIRDVVLIEQLDLDFKPGLCVMTGETGAGKSILLDSLGLAIGARSEARYVRHGSDQASVTATFDVTAINNIAQLLDEHGVKLTSGELLLRRVLNKDGKSRAFINDQPVSVGLLNQVGVLLTEIHGQFDNQRLMNPSVHKTILDTYGDYKTSLDLVSQSYVAWHKKAFERSEFENEIAIAKRDEDFLRYAVEELDRLKPEAGEETKLAEKRILMIHSEQLILALHDALEQLRMNNGADERLQKAARELGRVAEKAENRLDGVIGVLDRAINETAEAINQLERVAQNLDLDPKELENAEERLFALRALARKHNVVVDDLSELRTRMMRNLRAVEDGGAKLITLVQAEDEAKKAYITCSIDLREKRKLAASKLDLAVSAELGALKLGKANFLTDISDLAENEWSERGMDKIVFLVATNPGTPAGPLNKIASGGEMSRFMLALKVVLAESDTIGTLVFDEVDAGVGGAVAAAVGDRLERLAINNQILVVTHSPQVAARGQTHWRVSKSEQAQLMGLEDMTDLRISTTVVPLDINERKEEIARMLAGAEITNEARAAAESLLIRADE